LKDNFALAIFKDSFEIANTIFFIQARCPFCHPTASKHWRNCLRPRVHKFFKWWQVFDPRQNQRSTL